MGLNSKANFFNQMGTNQTRIISIELQYNFWAREN